VQAETRMPYQVFKRRYCSSFEGKLDSIYQHRNDMDGRKKTYAEAFNDDGTVNAPKFIEIARAEGKWLSGASATDLHGALRGLPSKVHRA